MDNVKSWNVQDTIVIGAHGDLHNVVHNKTGVKAVLKSSWVSKEKNLSRWNREKEILNKFNFSFVPAILDSGIHTWEPTQPGFEESINWFVQEKINGSTLKTLIEQNELSLEQKISIMYQLSSQFDEIHSFNVIHRDIKPSNILVDLDGHTHIIDFGISRADELLNMKSNITENGVDSLGTESYHPPEIFKKNYKGATKKLDIYSFSVTMYELFSGENPFRNDFGGQQGSVLTIIAQSDPKRKIKPLESFGVPSEIASIIKSGMKLSPTLRVSSFDTINQKLKKYIKKNSVNLKDTTINESKKKDVKGVENVQKRFNDKR